jgi:hypothetical protein
MSKTKKSLRNTRKRTLIAVMLFIIGGVILANSLPFFFQPTYLPQPGQPVGNDSSYPNVAATYVLSGARYFSCVDGGYQSSNGVVTLDSYYGFIWDASGNFVIVYQVFADASNGQIVQFMTHPFISAGLGPASPPQMRGWTIYDFDVGYFLLSFVLIVASVIMIIIAVILSIQLIYARVKRNKSSQGTIIDAKSYP